MQNILIKLRLRFGAMVLAVLLYIVGWKRKVIRENALRLGLPYSQLFRLKFYSHAALDFLRLLGNTYDLGIRIRPIDKVKLKILKTGSSLFLTAHFHHWERMGSWLTAQGVPLLSAARPLAQGWAQTWLHRVRVRARMKIIYRNLPRGALRHLVQEGCFALLWDQRVTQSIVRAPFFGASLEVDPLPGFLMKHHPAPVFFGCLLPDGILRLVQLAGRQNAGSGTHSLPSPDRLARRYHRVLEVVIRRHPTWWYGLAHRRFRDVDSAAYRAGVSRETLEAPEVMVSRETKFLA